MHLKAAAVAVVGAQAVSEPPVNLPMNNNNNHNSSSSSSNNNNNNNNN